MSGERQAPRGEFIDNGTTKDGYVVQVHMPRPQTSEYYQVSIPDSAGNLLLFRCDTFASMVECVATFQLYTVDEIIRRLPREEPGR